MPPADTVAAVRAVRERVGLEFFVGANFMAPAPFEAALQCGAALDAVWTDDGVDVEEGPRARACERLLSSPARREWISSCSSSSKFHFVGWLFKGKGRALPDDREAQMELLGSCVAELERFGAGTAICTTSGPGTGVPLEVERREPYRLALGQRSVMAVASGTTVDNVAQLVSSVDVFMVGTGIEKDETDPAVLEFWASAQIPAAPKVTSLDAEKIRAMAAIIHASADD